MLPPGVTLYGALEYDASVMEALQSAVEESLLAASFSTEEARKWRDALALHHQWLVVSVEHARMLVERREQIMEVSRGCVSCGGAWLVGRVVLDGMDGCDGAWQLILPTRFSVSSALHVLPVA